MTESIILPFLFEGEITVRVVERNGSPWFVTADVCRATAIANASQAVEALDDDEKGICSTYTLGGQQEMPVVSESGLFTLLLLSRDATKPGTLAYRFRRWVTGEVLPVVRRQGAYCPTEARPIVPWPLALRMVNTVRQTHGTRAAQQMWVRLNLPTVPAMHLRMDQGELFIPKPLTLESITATAH